MIKIQNMNYNRQKKKEKSENNLSYVISLIIINLFNKIVWSICRPRGTTMYSVYLNYQPRLKRLWIWNQNSSDKVGYKSSIKICNIQIDKINWKFFVNSI